MKVDGGITSERDTLDLFYSFPSFNKLDNLWTRPFEYHLPDESF